MNAVNVAASSGASPRVISSRYVERVTSWVVSSGMPGWAAGVLRAVAAEPGRPEAGAATSRAGPA